MLQPLVRTTLYLSPHFDDVALSCAGSLLRRTRAGERAILCTVFTRTRDRVAMHRRAAADLAACRLANAARVDLGFDDAPDRTRTRPSVHALVLDAALDPPTVAAVRAAIAAQIAIHRPDEIWLPLGIGGHIDHRTVFAARPRTRVPLVFYADRPYAFAPALVARRRFELGLPVAATSVKPPTAAAIAAQIARARMTRFFDPAERTAAFAALAHPPPRVEADLGRRYHLCTQRTRIRADETIAARALVAAYQSETRAWLPLYATATWTETRYTLVIR